MILTALTVTADDTTLIINPSNQTVSTSETFTVDVYCVPTEPIKGFELEISFDKSLIQAVSVTDGSIFDNFPYSFNSGSIDNSAGLITNIFGFIIGPRNTSNPGTFCTITFSSKSYGGTSQLKFNSEWTGVVNETEYISIELVNGNVKIDGPAKSPPVSPGTPSIPPISDEQNFQPETPVKPSGPTFIELGVEYEYVTSTFDVDNDNIRIKFDWGDGNFSEWSQFISSKSSIGLSYVWNNISTFSIRAIAQDEHGFNSSWSSVLNVTVSQVVNKTVPTPIIEFIGEPITNETITFNASESFDPEGIIVFYHWDFGDGKNGTGETCGHRYQLPGEYNITLTLTDDKGNNYSKSMTINISGLEDEIVEQDTDNSKLLPLSLFRNFIIGIFILIIILMIIVFRRNIKEFASFHRSLSFSEIFKRSNHKKIKKIDNKINKIQEDIQRLGVFYKPVRTNMDSSIDESIPRYVSADNLQDTAIKDKEDYNIDKYDHETKSKYERFLLDTLKSDSVLDNSNEVTEDEEDINVLVDRLLISKILEKHSLNSDKDFKKNVNDDSASKDFDEND